MGETVPGGARGAAPRTGGRILRFAVVGATGVGVNEGILLLLHGALGLPLVLASVIAIECSITSNYVLNSMWTWKYDFQGSARRAVMGWVRYHLVTGIVAFVVNVLLLMLLVKLFGVTYWLANLVGILGAAVLNFLGMELWVFRK